MKKQFYLRGSTIIESVIAISLITLCSLLGVMVYSSVTNTTPPISKFRYQSIVEQSIEMAYDTKEASLSQTNIGSARLVKKIMQHPLHKNIVSFDIQMFSSDETYARSIMIFKKQP